MRTDPSRQHPGARSIKRRAFLRAATTGAVAAWAAPAILHGKNVNEKLDIAIIGSGGRGGANLRSVRSENIVALCDVNENNLNSAARHHSKARKFRDFRKLYEYANEIDAVVVSTCEHTHAFATLPAIFGVNLQHGMEEAAPPLPFLGLIGVGVFCGAILTAFVMQRRTSTSSLGNAHRSSRQATTTEVA